MQPTWGRLPLSYFNSRRKRVKSSSDSSWARKVAAAKTDNLAHTENSLDSHEEVPRTVDLLVPLDRVSGRVDWPNLWPADTSFSSDARSEPITSAILDNG